MSIPGSVRNDRESLARHLARLDVPEVIDLVLDGDLAIEAIEDQRLKEAVIRAYEKAESEAMSELVEEMHVMEDGPEEEG